MTMVCHTFNTAQLVMSSEPWKFTLCVCWQGLNCDIQLFNQFCIIGFDTSTQCYGDPSTRISIIIAFNSSSAGNLVLTFKCLNSMRIDYTVSKSFMYQNIVFSTILSNFFIEILCCVSYEEWCEGPWTISWSSF